MSIPPAITKYIRYDLILPVIGSKVNGKLPEFSTCPICKGRIYVSADPRGGEWCQCLSCGFAGDLIALYGKYRDMDNVEAIIDRMISEGIPFESTQYDVVQGYIGDVEQNKAANALMQTGLNRVTQLTYKARELLQSMGLYRGYDGDLSKIIGCLHKKEVENSGLKIPWSFGSAALVMPFTDVPGRIRSFEFIHNKGSSNVVLSQNLLGECDAGLGMRHLVEPGTDTVYAVSDPCLAWDMQMDYRKEFGCHLPVVVWNVNTTKAWLTLSASRIIFIDVDTSIDLIRNALMAHETGAKVMISLQQQGISAFKSMPQEPISSFLGNVVKMSSPLCSVIKNQLLVNKYAAVETINKLKLKSNQVTDIIEAAESREEKSTLSGWFYGSEVSKRTTTGGHVIIEKNDGWYLETKDDLKRISNVKLIPEKLVRFTKSKFTQCSGRLAIDGKILPFTEDLDNIRDNTEEWINSVIFDAGMQSHLSVESRSWVSKLLQIGMDIYNPSVEAVDESIGWNREQDRWTFPNFVVCGGKVVLRDRQPLPTEPGCNIGYCDKHPKNYLNTPFASFLCQLNGLLLHNIIAPVMGWKPVGIVLTGDNAEDLLKAVKSFYGLTSLDTKLSAYGLTKATEDLLLPSVVCNEDTAKNIYDSIPTGAVYNVITVLRKEISRICLCYPRWVCIDTSNAPFDADTHNLVSEIPRAIKTLQQLNYSLPKEVDGLEAVFGLMCKAAASESGDVPIVVSDVMQKLSYCKNSKYGIAESVIMFMAYLSEQSGLSGELNPLVSKVDDGVMFIPGKLLEGLKKHGYLNIGIKNISLLLQDSGALIRITRNGFVLRSLWWKDLHKKIVGDLLIKHLRPWDLDYNEQAEQQLESQDVLPDLDSSSENAKTPDSHN